MKKTPKYGNEGVGGREYGNVPKGLLGELAGSRNIREYARLGGDSEPRANKWLSS